MLYLIHPFKLSKMTTRWDEVLNCQVFALKCLPINMFFNSYFSGLYIEIGVRKLARVHIVMSFQGHKYLTYIFRH